MLDGPVLYSFRRCPFAMRARWALWVAGVAVEHREIVLRDKPAAMLHASPKGTVPVLVLADGRVIDESLEVMRWALAQHDPEGWLQPGGTGNADADGLAPMLALIDACQQHFKPHLDRSKYPQRYVHEWWPWPASSDGQALASGAAHAHAMAAYVQAAHAQAAVFLRQLDGRLQAQAALFGARPALADFAIAPFVRQYAKADAAHWAHGVAGGTWARVDGWLNALLARPEFDAVVMRKHPVWQPD